MGGVALAGLAARVAFAAWFSPLLLGDASHNVFLAQNIWAGRGYSSCTQPPFNLNGNRPPGYALLLAPLTGLFDSPEHVVPWLQMLMDAAVAVMVARLVARRHGHWAGIAAAACWWLSPVSIAFSSQLLSSTFAALLVTLLLRELDRDPVRPLAVGVTAGGAALTVSALAPTAALLVLMARSRFSRRGLGLALAAMGLMLAVWGVRNLQAGGRFTPLTLVSSGGPLYASMEEDGVEDVVVRSAGVYDRWLEQWTPQGIALERAMQLDGELRAVCVDEIAHRPRDHVERQARQIWKAWTRPDGLVQNCRVDRAADVIRPVLPGVAAAWECATLLLALIGLARWRRQLLARQAAAAALLITLSYGFVRAETRYLVPALPALAVLVGLAVSAGERDVATEPCQRT